MQACIMPNYVLNNIQAVMANERHFRYRQSAISSLQFCRREFWAITFLTITNKQLSPFPKNLSASRGNHLSFCQKRCDLHGCIHTKTILSIVIMTFSETQCFYRVFFRDFFFFFFLSSNFGLTCLLRFVYQLQFGSFF